MDEPTRILVPLGFVLMTGLAEVVLWLHVARMRGPKRGWYIFMAAAVAPAFVVWIVALAITITHS